MRFEPQFFGLPAGIYVLAEVLNLGIEPVRAYNFFGFRALGGRAQAKFASDG